MKNNGKNINMKRIIIVIVCLLLTCILAFGLVACSKKDETNPANFDTQPAEETPSDNTSPDDSTTDPTNPDDVTPTDPHDINDPDDPGQTDDPNDPTDPEDNPVVVNELENFANIICNTAALNAKSEISVTFGGRILAKETREYTRTENGGTIKTTTVSLDTANAKDPYKTQETTNSFESDEFESLFPDFSAIISKANFKGETYNLQQTQDGVATLTFTVESELAKTLLNLTDDEANSIATDISVVMIAKDEKPQSFVAVYKTSSGNTVEINVVYTLNN